METEEQLNNVILTLSSNDRVLNTCDQPDPAVGVCRSNGKTVYRGPRNGLYYIASKRNNTPYRRYVSEQVDFSPQ